MSQLARDYKMKAVAVSCIKNSNLLYTSVFHFLDHLPYFSTTHPTKIISMNAMYVQQGYTALTKPEMSLFFNIIVGP